MRRSRAGTNEVLAGDAERGASMVEYALLLVLVFLVALFSVLLFGEALVGLFEFAAGVFGPE